MDQYQQIISATKRKYRIRIHRWRPNLTGCAWRVEYRDGTAINWIESPLPQSPLSLCIFLHEVGHHIIGFDRYHLRCEEEYHAWRWAISAMRKAGIRPDAQVLHRFNLSMRYAVEKALRRGLKHLPPKLVRFAPTTTAST